MARPQDYEHHQRFTLQRIGHSYGCGFCYSGMRDGSRLYFSGAYALACDLYRVIGAAQDVPEAVFVNARPVAMHPQAWYARPVRVEVALAGLPEAARYAGPGVPDGKLAHRATHRLSIGVYHVGGHAGHGRAEGARLEGEEGVAAEDAARYFGAARIVDDG